MRGRRARGPRGPSARPAGSERRYFFGIVDRRFAPSRRGFWLEAPCRVPAWPPRAATSVLARPAVKYCRFRSSIRGVVAIAPAYIVHSDQRVSQALRGGRGEVRAPPAGHVLESCARVEISGTSRSEPACAVACVGTRNANRVPYTLLGTHYKNTRGILGVYCPYTQLVSTTRIIIGFVMRHAVKKMHSRPNLLHNHESISPAIGMSALRLLEQLLPAGPSSVFVINASSACHHTAL